MTLARGQHAETADLGLAGRVALVTGGTRGIGLAIAARLCAAGVRVHLAYSRSDADAAAAAERLSGLKGQAVLVRRDVTAAGALSGLVTGIAAADGGLDILVHSAASWHPMSLTAGDWAGLSADLTAAVRPLADAAPALPAAMAGRPGRVVAVSSAGARFVVPGGYASLGIAKAALEAAVRYLAVELAPHDIAVNAVSTAKVDKGEPSDPQHAMVAALAARTPGGRLTAPPDIADLVALLCADAAAWVRGQVVTADGGLSLLA
jgi:enoyl-[acyl-carrier protein] reductase III